MTMLGPQNGEQFLRNMAREVQRLSWRPTRPPRPLVGPSVDRPDPTLLDPGTVWFDTTLGKPVWANGTAWVDATGTVV